MSEARLQFSAGGVVYRKRGKEAEIILLTRGQGKISCLPKGKLEKSETTQRAALREVREETGLNGIIEKRLGKIKYCFYAEDDKPRALGGKYNVPAPEEEGKARILKTVTFFLIKYESGDTANHDTDAEEVRWLPVGEALKIMSYPSEREIVKKAKKLF
jgi:8-oxo-dGTP diphosphatase